MTHKSYLAAVGSVLTASVVLTGCSTPASATDSQRNADAKQVTLSITSNAIFGGKGALEADWITKYVIPQFEAEQKKKGVDVKVTFNPNGVDDEAYKTKISLEG